MDELLGWICVLTLKTFMDSSVFLLSYMQTV